jgi:hypothetical protein
MHSLYLLGAEAWQVLSEALYERFIFTLPTKWQFRIGRPDWFSPLKLLHAIEGTGTGMMDPRNAGEDRKSGAIAPRFCPYHAL